MRKDMKTKSVITLQIDLSTCSGQLTHEQAERLGQAISSAIRTALERAAEPQTLVLRWAIGKRVLRESFYQLSPCLHRAETVPLENMIEEVSKLFSRGLCLR